MNRRLTARAKDRSWLLWAFACVAAVAPLAAQKTDTVTLANGDLITGEIKELTHGKLEYKTDDFSTVYIKWSQVRGLASRYYFEVEDETGRRYYGALPPAAEPGKLVVSLAQRTDTLEIDRVVSIAPIAKRFWSRFRGRLDLGFNYAKANTNVTLNTSGNARYQVTRSETNFSFSSYFQSQDNVSATSRNAISLGYQWFPARHWSVGGSAQLQQNQELGLALRAILGAGGFRTLAQTSHTEFKAGLGLLGTSERSYGVDSVTLGLEAQLGTSFDLFSFDKPKLEVTTTLQLNPSLTELGRIRGEFDGRARYEIIRNFTVGLNLEDSYDSRPATSAATKNDIVASFTVGWTF